MADTTESRGWLGFVYPLGDGIFISETVVDLVLSGPTLETSKLSRTILRFYTPADIYPEGWRPLDDGRVPQRRYASLAALAATLAVLALGVLVGALSVSTPATASLRIAVST